MKSGDLVTFVRKDIKSHIIKDSTIKEIIYNIISVKAEGEIIHIINIYARDGKLQHQHLTYLMDKYKNAILTGDLNAKHQELLQHTQKTPYNRNGVQLKTYIEGKDRLHTAPPSVLIHNINDPMEWTHTTPDGKWAQIDYIISHLSITHKLTETQYEYNLISDHQGISVRAPELFPETHTTSRTKFVPDWRTYNEWKYKFITEMEMEAAIVNGNWYEQPTHKKVELFTNIQKYAFENSINFKQVSQRGNTKPRYIIELIKQKRRLENGLRKMVSDTRKKKEEAYTIIFSLVQVPVKFHYNDESYDFWFRNQKNFRTEIHSLARKINKAIIKTNKENWDKELTKLGETDIRKAPKEFYSTMKRLGGMGRNRSVISKMEYNGVTTNTEEGIANLMADSAQDTFKPLEDTGFDYSVFQKIEDEWDNAQEALDSANGIIQRRNIVEDNFTWNPMSNIINNLNYLEGGQSSHNPNPTKHQAKEWEIPITRKYKNIKEPLPPALNPNFSVDKYWTEELAHNCNMGEKELEKAYRKFTIEDILKNIHKMKRKAPGHDNLVIDQFKDLGYGCMDKLLELYNEIFTLGRYPDPWKQAIVVPILKKNKPAKDPASYRPISLLPIAGKILESLVLNKLEP